MLSALPEAVARPVLVQKYGGTSLATPARIKRVAQRIARNQRNAKARIVGLTPAHIERELAEGGVVVVAGFQGIGEEMEVTTLGRGGSDTTAVAIAAALKARTCEILTDVRGIYTADPRFVPNARLLPHIAYPEMLELATSDARVMHPRAVELAEAYAMELHV